MYFDADTTSPIGLICVGTVTIKVVVDIAKKAVSESGGKGVNSAPVDVDFKVAACGVWYAPHNLG